MSGRVSGRILKSSGKRRKAKHYDEKTDTMSWEMKCGPQAPPRGVMVPGEVECMLYSSKRASYGVMPSEKEALKLREAGVHVIEIAPQGFLNPRNSIFFKRGEHARARMLTDLTGITKNPLVDFLTLSSMENYVSGRLLDYSAPAARAYSFRHMDALPKYKGIPESEWSAKDKLSMATFNAGKDALAEIAEPVFQSFLRLYQEHYKTEQEAFPYSLLESIRTGKT